MRLLEYFKDYYHGYQVSNCGRVISPRGQEIKHSYTKKGYHQVTVKTYSGKLKTHLVHRLVALLFVANDMPLFKTQVNHMLECKAWNVAHLLEWCTDSANKIAKFDYRRKHGLPLYTDKERHAKDMLTIKQSKPVAYRGAVYASVAAMATHFRRDPGTISKAIYRSGKWRGYPIRFVA